MPQSEHHSRGGNSSQPGTEPLLSPAQLAGGTLALIVVAIFIAYWPAVGGALVWNDSDYVTKPELRSLHGLTRIWFEVGATEQYYPLLHSFFWVQSQFWGDSPVGYHLVNLALHATAVCLLYLVLRKLRIPGALLASAIFALHPVMVESVAWISEQKNTLSTVLYLGALLAYLHFDESRKASLYAAAFAIYLLAIFSKTVTATLPAALLVIFWWQRGDISWRRDVQPLLPWFAIGIVGGLFTSWVELKYIGAEGAAFDLTPMQHLLIAGRIPWFYAGKLLWPADLIFMYPRWVVDPAVWWQWLFPLAALAMCGALWLVRSRWRTPLAAWLLFIGTLVPVLGFFNVYWFIFSFVADHFLYLASLGVIVPVAAAIALAILRIPVSTRWVGNALCIVLLSVLGALTWQQAKMYSDIFALYQTTIDRNPNSWLAHNNFGIALADAGRLDEAIAHYQKSLELKPDNAKAHNNFGSTLAQAGRQQEAIEQYQQALKLNPNFPAAQNNLGIALFSVDRTEEAIAHFKEAVRLDPDFADAHRNLGAALGKAGRLQAAVEEFEKALILQPNNVQIYANLMTAYVQLQRPNDAIAAAAKAAELASAQGQPALAQQIAAWLGAYRASLSKQSGKGATSKVTSPSP